MEALGDAVSDDGAVSPADVHDAVRRLILECVLEPGSDVSQPELSRRLAVSRTPLREALRLLEREGLVVNEGRHRSYRVSPLTMPDLDDLYSSRVLGEALAIWLSVPVLRPSDYDALEKELDAIEAGDMDAHRRFHAGHRVGAGKRLQDQLERSFDHAERYQRVFYANPDKATVLCKLQEHREILAACRAGDRQLARELIVDHVASTALALMTAERYAPFSLPHASAIAKQPLLQV